MRSIAGTAAVVALCAAGCPDRDLGEIRPQTQTYIDIVVAQAGEARVDIVVLVDNSGSMKEEQAELTERFGDLIRGLFEPPDADLDTAPDWPTVGDLNIAVISSDMGTAGYDVGTCANSDYGDDGCFRDTPSPAISGCAAGYDRFLHRENDAGGAHAVDAMAHDFQCIATLGTKGCGFEQQLEAMRKAVVDNVRPGSCNASDPPFIRPDSVVALLFVTDENDCSVEDPTIFCEECLSTCMNLRCFLHPEMLRHWEGYIEAFRNLRADHPDRIVLAMIVGVPIVPECDGVRGDDLDACLRHPDMQERVNPAEPCEIYPSCVTDMGVAYPPVRLVKVAQAWGVRSIVSSICRNDWSPAIRAITGLITDAIPDVCFPRQLEFVAEDDNDEATSGVADRDCVANCRAVETYRGDDPGRPCLVDPACPPEWCPEASVDDYEVRPCVNPGTGETCEPLKRDLGCTGGDCVNGSRQCLLRQAERDYDDVAGACGAPADRGWYYVGPGMGYTGCGSPSCVADCPMLVLRDESGFLVEPSSEVHLRCLSFLCPADRQCGSEVHPTAGCCVEGHEGTLGPGSALGTCLAKSCPAGTVPAPVPCSIGQETAGTCVPI